MNYLTLATALGSALAATIVSAAPPAAPPPPITGGVRVPGGFSYPYTRPPNLTLMRPDYTIYPSGATAPAYGYQSSRYPLGAAPAKPRIVWYW
ncbi:MAG TPA: hypothetical protein VHV55_23550 [Pirellulales bacterium]|jgi:hypothetical protein|nr:hypothetical protein [Pirellulales bacterium]